MPTGGVLVILALVAIGIATGEQVVKGVKKVDHGVCYVATLGKHCKKKHPVKPIPPEPAPTPVSQGCNNKGLC